MDILIDNKNIESEYGITVLDYTGALSLPETREDEIIWADKSGVDPNLENIRYEPKEFIMKFILEAKDPITAKNTIEVLTNYMRSKRVFVLSLRDSINNTRDSMICERSSTIIPKINIRQQNSLFVFSIGFKDINPSALKFQTSIFNYNVDINYTKGAHAIIYWGDGSRGEVSNSGYYSKNNYSQLTGLVDVIIDIDNDNTPIVEPLVAAFSATPLVGEMPLEVQFTDESQGTPVLWSWSFGDGTGSTEQNPIHTYSEIGTYTVTLQIFNSQSGNDLETKTNYITVNPIPFPEYPFQGIAAYVSKNFTLYLKPYSGDAGTWHSHIYIDIYLNKVLKNTYKLTANTAFNLFEINEVFSNVKENSLLEVKWSRWYFGLVFNRGTINMIDAGMTKFLNFDPYNTDDNPPTEYNSFYKMDFSLNNLEQNDVNNLIESLDKSVEEAPQGYMRIDISGGTSAIPTTTEALAVKSLLNANQVYFDNE